MATVLTNKQERVRNSICKACLVLSVFWFFVASVYIGAWSSVLTAIRDYYPSILPGLAWRQPHLEARMSGYRFWFPWIGGSFFVYWVYLTFLQVWSANQWKKLGSLLRSRSVVFFLTVIAFFAVGMLVYFFSNREWEAYQRPCWDQYCDYASLLADLISNPSERSWVPFRHFLDTDYHANSPLGPVLIAIVSLITRLSVVSSYRLCCAVATAASVGLFWHFCKQENRVESELRLPAVILLLTHLSVVRSSFFPQTDAFVLLWAMILIILAYRRFMYPKTRYGLALFALLASGLFVKLSFLPALAFVPLLGLGETCFRQTRGVWVKSFWREVGLFSILPLVPYLIFQVWMGTTRLYGVEFENVKTPDSTISFMVESFLHTILFFIPPLILGWKSLRKPQCGAALWVCLYCASIWISRASGWDRFYLAALPALVFLSCTGLARLRWACGLDAVWVFIIWTSLLNFLALNFRIYH
jgi:hypothetical protein